MSDTVVDVLRRELKRSAENLKVENDEVLAILKNEVLKRDAIEGEEATKAQTRIKRASNKSLRAIKDKADETPASASAAPTSQTPAS